MASVKGCPGYPPGSLIELSLDGEAVYPPGSLIELALDGETTCPSGSSIELPPDGGASCPPVGHEAPYLRSACSFLVFPWSGALPGQPCSMLGRTAGGVGGTCDQNLPVVN